MCGIAGILSLQPVAAGTLSAMAGRLRHRGPDDDGVWIEERGQVGFGHRRLSIIDLSPAGHQPMRSADGRYVLSYNGEIYNHTEIRREIDGQFGKQAWRGHSDTETLVEAIARWGLESTLTRCVGMFALSLWDAKERRLHLARDRFGEKPLYYGWVGGDFVFASELPAIQLHPRFDNHISRAAVRTFASRTYIPAPLSIFEQIYKLQPGCILSASAEVAAHAQSEASQPGFANAHLKLERYWSYRQTVMDGLALPFEDEKLALEELEAALSHAVMGQSLADVPVGAFLSGGIDSSTVVALYQKYSSKPVRTYTIGFEDPAYDEAPAAREVARHLGTQHHELYVTSRDAQDVIPKLASIYGEPFADSSQIPTYLISAFARDEVKVALSGDGGDELFGGYNRHLMAPRLWRSVRRIPKGIRNRTSYPLSLLPEKLWSQSARIFGLGHRHYVGAKIRKALRTVGAAANFDDIYLSFLDEWHLEPSPVLGSSAENVGFDLDAGDGAHNVASAMYCDAIAYLPDDILCKVDRASMAVSLESRVPYLDHRVAAVAARIPLNLKLRGGRGKHILRELLYREAPRHLFERPKAGFAIPVCEWIKGPLRPWAEELLDPLKMAEEGWFDPNLIHRRWRDHLAGRRDSTAALWAILMFQNWLREQKQSVALAA